MQPENDSRLLGVPNARQREFFLARTRFIAYGGARGGGKSWAVRKKALLMALRWPGIRMLLVRRSYPELRENHIEPLRAETRAIAAWRESEKVFVFKNGSRLKCGYCDGEGDVTRYQGQEYDVIFLDEATQLTERQFSALCACLRGANARPKRMYLTCNPGGVGHDWVKRLFLDRAYRTGERPADYTFIPARVYDNTALLAQDPGYVRALEALPDGMRAAWLDGSWELHEGRFFKEWREDAHVCAPFAVPPEWQRFVTLDYGLDMLAAYLIAVDRAGCAYVCREVYRSGLIISDACAAVRDMLRGERADRFLAPPDLWSRRQETGRSVADLFYERGILLERTSNDRRAGWLAVRELLRVQPDGNARLRVFDGCRNLIRTMAALRASEHDPADACGTPHELTHAPDALRGFCISFVPQSAPERAPRQTPDPFGLLRPRARVGLERSLP
ncbi:MAG: hypothetical protein EOM69_11255, partial [Clostridia bacterium]|nr:hypothetical protein [Clostridia bacterium]